MSGVRNHTEAELRHRREAYSQAGFSIVELVIAVVILAIGVLGLAGATSFMVRQTNLADLQTERTAAMVAGLERLMALPFDSVVNGSDSVGAFRVEWTVIPQSGVVKVVRLITEGPGLTPSGGGMPIIGPAVQDTFIYNVLRP
jgi:prepilin-type N-terminal cleavage/methylation domain-containing protein